MKRPAKPEDIADLVAALCRQRLRYRRDRHRRWWAEPHLARHGGNHERPDPAARLQDRAVDAAGEDHRRHAGRGVGQADRAAAHPHPADRHAPVRGSGGHGEDPGRAQADRGLQVHHVPDGDPVALVRLYARHHRRQHARRQLRRRGRPQSSRRGLPVGRSHERRVVRQQGGLGRAPGADAARARRQVQRPRRLAAALGAARSARHLPVLRHARPDDLFHQRPAVSPLPPLRLHRAPARAPAPTSGAGRSPRARPRCRCPASPSGATAAWPTTSC